MCGAVHKVRQNTEEGETEGGLGGVSYLPVIRWQTKIKLALLNNIIVKSSAIFNRHFAEISYSSQI